MGSERKTAKRDSIAHFMREWARERPDIDPWPLGILGRIQRLSIQLQRLAAEDWLAPLGLTWENFSLLMALRRSGRPYQLRPTDIYRESLLTSGAVTNRIDRVELNGWVRRIPDAGDRRATLIQLTPDGRALADRAIALHFKRLEETFGCLTKAERHHLSAILSKLLGAVEQRAQAEGARIFEAPRKTRPKSQHSPAHK
jgi:DNA-binding MarR family transcriptional regulator